MSVRQRAACDSSGSPGLASRAIIAGDVLHARETTMAILGGAMLPHAPQFFTMPPTEDADNVAQVREVARRIGQGLAALSPDVWIVIANDHAQQFFHQCAPAFTLHVGGEARGAFAGRQFHWQVPSELSFALVRDLYRSGFDPAFTSTAEIDYAMGIPMTHVGSPAVVLPVYVNAYLPPQPTIERCYAFGQALARSLDRLGVRAVVVASGGMSHFPGTASYDKPDNAFDLALLEQLRAGRLKSLIGLSEEALDASGNIELRCWALAAGMLGDRVPDICQWNPSWHHNYASLGFLSSPPDAVAPHYPSIRPELVALTAALHAIAHDPAARSRFMADPKAYAAASQVPESQRVLLETIDMPAMAAIGVHPLVPFLAHLQIEHLRRQEKG
jgi:2,3-dihydroxyphenylpropionate 1,2-dioxygenase